MLSRTKGIIIFKTSVFLSFYATKKKIKLLVPIYNEVVFIVGNPKVPVVFLKNSVICTKCKIPEISLNNRLGFKALCLTEVTSFIIDSF